MTDTDNKKLDQIITMLGDVISVFGTRFDKIERDMATKEQLAGLQTQVNSIERQLRETKTDVRLGNLEEKAFASRR